MTIEERQNLSNLTDEELSKIVSKLEADLEVCKQKWIAQANVVKEDAKKLQQYFYNYFKQFVDDVNLVLRVDIGDIDKPTAWEDEQDSPYRVPVTIGLRLASKDNDYNDESFAFNVFAKCIEAGTTGYGSFKRTKRPCVPTLLIMQGMMWMCESNFTMKCAEVLRVDELEKRNELRKEYYHIDADLDYTKRVISNREVERKVAKCLEELKNGVGKYYVYIRKDDYRKVERFYKINRVGNKTVNMTEICFSGLEAYKDADYQYSYATHNFKIEGDVLDEMMLGYGKVMDNLKFKVDEIKAAIAKSKAEREAQLAKKNAQ